MEDRVYEHKVIYQNNRYHIQHPLARRNILDIFQEVKAMERSRILSWEWDCQSYGACIIYMVLICLVYDSMQIFPLSLGRGPKLEIALREGTKNKPSYFKGWWPSHINDRLSYWKAEKYQHFVACYLPYVIDRFS